jgi:hypothetical protein
MNLTPKEAHNSNPVIKGSTRTVWQLLLRVAHRTDPPTRKFQVSRREIQKEAGIGSLNTIDNALENLESYGLLRRYSVPGSNDGYIYELLTLKENPVPKINKWSIAATLRQLADSLEQNNIALTPQQIGKWSKLTYQARRLMPSDQV